MFNYKYFIKLELVNPVKKLQIDAHLQEIQNAINQYNELSIRRTKNPKKLILEHIQPDKIILALQSIYPIEKIGMAIRYFSEILIKTSSAFSDVTWNKQLFSITQIEFPEIENNSTTTSISAKSIDDATFLKSLIDFLLNKSNGSSTEYRNKVIAVDKMKLLAIKAGIINLDALELIDRPDSKKCNRWK